ncbi:MAG: hypothetical protein IJ083_05505 [Clostridia bacterium]|nr:hypothetical protein [Clostridia bacterium]
MKYHIDTIPVWDAVKLDGECFLCALHRKMELGEAERYLGASVMEPDTRIQVNELGFCRRHHAMLYSMSNRLGHALMLESHLNVTREKMEKISGKLSSAASALEKASFGKIGRAGQNAREEILRQAKALSDMSDSCILCASIQENMDRYLHTFFHLYKNDSEFRERIQHSKGICLPHMGDLIRVSADELSSKECAAFIQMILKLQKENMDRMQEDISWFIKKFDYRFQNEPWKNSQDAVPRAVNKLRGWCVGDEPNPEE